MEIVYRSKFNREFKKLPKGIKEIARVKIKLFLQNPFDARLKTHKLGGELSGFWSFSVTYDYRLIFDFLNFKKVRFYSIGNHDIYAH